MLTVVKLCYYMYKCIKLSEKDLYKHCIKSTLSLIHRKFCSKNFPSLVVANIKGALDKFNIIPQLFSKKVGIVIPLEVLIWVMTACWVLLSRLIYFRRNMNICSIFYFSKSTSINTQYSSLWNTLKMMLFTKYLIKWKRIGRFSWKFWYWYNIIILYRIRYKKIDVILVQCLFKL